MKILLILSMVSCSVWLFGSSCQKQQAAPTVDCPETPRKIQFSLFTAKDFSKNNSWITFTLSIRTANHQTLWDSVLAPIKIKDIPRIADKLIIEKQVPGNVCSSLRVGFIYAIEDVGISWYWDKSNAGEVFKEVAFDFR